MNINEEYPVTDPQLASKERMCNPIEEIITTYNVSTELHGTMNINVYGVYETQEELDAGTPTYFNLFFEDNGECITEWEPIYAEEIEGATPSFLEVCSYVENYLSDCE